jgi:hypothetical protein
MKRFFIKSSLAKSIQAMCAENTVRSVEIYDALCKANYKYIKRWRDPKNPKKWCYLYAKDVKRSKGKQKNKDISYKEWAEGAVKKVFKALEDCKEGKTSPNMAFHRIYHAAQGVIDSDKFRVIFGLKGHEEIPTFGLAMQERYGISCTGKHKIPQMNLNGMEEKLRGYFRIESDGKTKNENASIDRSQLEVGDRYVARDTRNIGGRSADKFVVRTVGKRGEMYDGYVAAVPPGGGVMSAFAGVQVFDTQEQAQKWITEHPQKKKKAAGLPQGNKDFIEQNIHGRIIGNRLYNEDRTGYIPLTGENLTYYNSAYAKITFKNLADVLASGNSQKVFNNKMGCEITIDKGHTGQSGHGLLHIIEGRSVKDNLNEDEIAALLYKVVDAAENGFISNSIKIDSRGDNKRVGLEKDGIIAITGKRYGTDGERIVITGYALRNKKEEAADAVQTVSAQYGYTPEFSDFRKQVGAVVSSLSKVSSRSDEMSSSKPEKSEEEERRSRNDEELGKKKKKLKISKSLAAEIMARLDRITMPAILVKAAAQRDEDDELADITRRILEHLDTLDDDDDDDEIMAKAKAARDGEIRTRKDGKKYRRKSAGVWEQVYEEHSRGAKVLVAKLKRKISEAKTGKEKMQILMEHKERFSDKHGDPLPFALELYDFAKKEKSKAHGAAIKEGKRKGKHHKADEKEFVQEMNEKLGGKKKAKGISQRGQVVAMQTRKPKENAASQEIKNKFTSLAVKANHYEFTPENYKELFPGGKIKTPLGEVKLGKNQYKKLDIKGRTNLLGAMQQTLSDPIYIISSEGTEIYAKSFKGGKDTDIIVSVVISMDGEKISISTHRRDLNNVVNKIKAGNILYEKDAALNGQSTHGSENQDNASAEATPSTGSNGGSLGTGAHNHLKQVSSPSDEKSSSDKGGIEAIREKYISAKNIAGDKDKIQIGKEKIAGTWKLVEADAPTASHDETTFQKTPGFPANADGSSINDRDYEHFVANKEAVLKIASDYDGRAVSLDEPVVVTTDGVVISGNNRTMSSKLAAQKGTDTEYIETLKEKAKKFGFTEAQISGFKHPRVVFEVKQNGEYSTAQFAKFNDSGKKEMGSTEKAIKVSKLITKDAIEAVAQNINEFDTIGELYQNAQASKAIFAIFKNKGLIGENETGRCIENGILTEAGKDFIETALLGTVINEANLRGLNRGGCKSIRGTLMRALIPLVENKGLQGGYSINKELNEAVDIAMLAATQRDKFRDVDEFSRQGNMFEKLDPVAVEIAKKTEGTQKAFAAFFKEMNGSLKMAADGNADIFLGDVESREDILKRLLTLKKAITEWMQVYYQNKTLGETMKKKKLRISKALADEIMTNLERNRFTLPKSIIRKAQGYDPLEEFKAILAEGKKQNDDKLEYFRRKLLKHLNSQDDESDGVMAKGKAAQGGEVRTWQDGKKHKKVGKTWELVSEGGRSGGAKRAIGKIKRGIREAATAEDMLKIVMDNKERFSENGGEPCRLVLELHEYANKEIKKRDRAASGIERKKKVTHEWNPVARNNRMAEPLVARILANPKIRQAAMDPENKDRMVITLRKDHWLSEDDANKFVDKLANLSSKDYNAIIKVLKKNGDYEKMKAQGKLGGIAA